MTVLLLSITLIVISVNSCIVFESHDLMFLFKFLIFSE